VEGMRLVLEETRCHAKDPGFIEASSSVLVSSRVEQEYEGVATLSHASSRVAFVRRTARRERRRGLLFDLRAKPVALPFEGWSIAGQRMLKICRHRNDCGGDTRAVRSRLAPSNAGQPV
jgi:hypothetical protein